MNNISYFDKNNLSYFNRYPTASALFISSAKVDLAHSNVYISEIAVAKG